MTGFDNILNELAKTLDISNNALKSALSAFGDNYQQIYQNLAREYTLYSIFHNLMGIFVFSTFITSVLFILLNIFYLLDDDGFRQSSEQESRSMVCKKVLKTLGAILAICIIALVICIFSPIFYPNINLIMELIRK